MDWGLIIFPLAMGVLGPLWLAVPFALSAEWRQAELKEDPSKVYWSGYCFLLPGTFWFFFIAPWIVFGVPYLLISGMVRLPFPTPSTAWPLVLWVLFACAMFAAVHPMMHVVGPRLPIIGRHAARGLEYHRKLLQIARDKPFWWSR